MIQTLHIANFQSHKDTTLDFHPGVNVIVGESDSGKTSIIRAARWLIWNRPNGDDFRSDWGGETEVSIGLKNDVKVARVKDKENGYYLTNPDKYKEFKAFGTKVPEEIQKVLNIDDTNLQKQFDSPFLISASPGEVAGYFNQIAHLERIDSSISYVNGQITSLTAKQKVDKVSLEEFQEEYTQYDYLDKFEIDLEELEHQQSAQTQRIVSRKRLNEHLQLMSEKDQMIKKQEQITVLKKPVDVILAMYGELGEMETEYGQLQSALISITQINRLTKSLSKKISLQPKVKALLKLHKERKEMIKNRRELRLAERELTTISKSQFEYEVLIEEKEAKFHKYMPDECPLCGETKSK